MTATEQWIFLCAAHKTPKEVSRDCGLLKAHFSHQQHFHVYDLFVSAWGEIHKNVLCFCIHSALPLITPGTRWTELPVFSIATNTSPAGQSSSLNLQWLQQKWVVNTTLTYHHLLSSYVELVSKQLVIYTSSIVYLESCLCHVMNVSPAFSLFKLFLVLIASWGKYLSL